MAPLLVGCLWQFDAVDVVRCGMEGGFYKCVRPVRILNLEGVQRGISGESSWECYFLVSDDNKPKLKCEFCGKVNYANKFKG